MSARDIFTKDVVPLLKGKSEFEQAETLGAIVMGMLIGQAATSEQIKQITKQVKKLNKSK